ncbi:hypothetical protein [Candidatus Enterococcus clewellii]|uniref:Ethanolamine utilization protein EutQ n=1 Tax=Candidatus Enterococcus clewellii TaxID=1834193 RepID=A0A242KBZ9_9ENTE|nr:hypothetical protein [Enterococcus sp. 9E7_DIV0242]OTP18695.1 hypothetical protein A5888_000509 [Enterococcus sp. 9E7_DIV0242]
MKKLISIADIEQLLVEKAETCVLTHDTIVTPAAIDFAEEKGIRFITQEPDPISTKTMTPFDSNKLVNDMLQLLTNKDILYALMASLKEEPYEFEQDDSGVKIIHGKTVKMTPLEENDKQICGQVLFKNDNETVEAGLLTIKGTDFSIKTKSEELNLVLEGNLIIRINGKAYKAQEGDLVSIPIGTQLERSATEHTKIFYIRS